MYYLIQLPAQNLLSWYNGWLLSMVIISRKIYGGAQIWNFSSNGWAQRTSEVSSWTREENFISASNDVLFCLSYKHNNPVLTGKVNFINEWKWRIDNPLIKLVNSETPQKQTMGVIFNTRNSQLLTFTYRQKKFFRYMAKICLWKNYQSSIFVFSREKCNYLGNLIRNIPRFLFPYIPYSFLYPTMLGCTSQQVYVFKSTLIYFGHPKSTPYGMAMRNISKIFM